MIRWVSMHCLAFNVNSDLKYFDYIVACGIKDKNKTVTSLEKEWGKKPDLQDIKNRIFHHFIELFQIESYEKKNMQTISDRKSTRLNSSHVAISYAVFCLQKKNKHCNSTYIKI